MSNIETILDAIDPSQLEYQDWLRVGMALHTEGRDAAEWDRWSARDSARYKPGECLRKWAGFHGAAHPVTGGTLVELAKRQGWTPQRREWRAYSWEEESIPAIDLEWIEDVDVAAAPENDDWNPAHEVAQYISTLFESSEHVGYVMGSWVAEDGRHLPQKGCYSRTAGELLAALAEYGGDLGAALGDYDPEAGAWIRFNPLDGQGVKDSNVIAFRYALIESDTVDIERQAAIYQELELPIAVLVHSGGKSLHAIVRINATTREEYRERVNYLHEVCNRNGLAVDGANKNPSRLSRMPGIMRRGQKQYIVATNQGKPSWEAWRAYIEELNDNLPDIESFDDVWDNLPALKPALIENILRQGHKMLLSGPSKAGKSYLLLQLVAAIAEGKEWLGWQCAQGRVLYVNLELDSASCDHRIRDVYDAKGWTLTRGNLDVWHLRGRAVPMDVFAPKLIRRARKGKYIAVIIDPIYKVITGDENAADKMAYFCNQFDMVCHQLGAAVIYCHHHSKGAQGGKSARDRSSGSGVFARDPDAILDMIELTVSDSLREQLINQETCAALATVLDMKAPGWRENISQDDALMAAKLTIEARRILGREGRIEDVLFEARKRAGTRSGWRIEGTLREFAPFPPRRVWFGMPIHLPDPDNLLADAKADGEEPPWQRGKKDRRKAQVERRNERQDALSVAYQSITFDGAPDTTIEALAEHMGMSDRTIRNRIKEHARLTIRNGRVVWRSGGSDGGDEKNQA